MELHKALRRAAKLAAKGKNVPEHYKAIRFVPAGPVGDPIVWATDGLVSVAVKVDVEVPEVLLPMDGISKVMKHEVISIEPQGKETWFKVKNGGVYKLANMELKHFPHLPTIPRDFLLMDYWYEVMKVIHAAADDKGKPAYQVIRFGNDWVGATDESRVAVVEMDCLPQPILIPSRLFKDWPAGMVGIQQIGDVSWFRIGEDEYRWGPTKGATNYPDLRDYTQKEPEEGGYITVVSKQLQDAAKKATIAKAHTVVLEFDPPKLVMKSWAEEDGGKGFKRILKGISSVKRDPQITESISIVVNGKYLQQAIKPVTTPNIRLQYGGALDPLRIVAGPYTEIIQPWRV